MPSFHQANFAFYMLHRVRTLSTLQYPQAVLASGYLGFHRTCLHLLCSSVICCGNLHYRPVNVKVHKYTNKDARLDSTCRKHV